MQIRCPHCQNAIELVDDSDFQSIDCPSCGSQFSLVDVDQREIDTLSKSRGTIATIGHFELIEEVGRGAFGTVWRARDAELDRQVAVKIPRDYRISAEDRVQFLREARSTAQLSHPNIVTVYEVGRDGEQLYIVSDFAEGVTLAEKLTAQRLSPREAVTLCVKIAAALEHAHENGVIHRDLKPSNIMLTADGEPQVMDFGLAKREAGEITVTVEGKVLGTPAYMPPEQARGEGHHVDRRADVYSLGVILYELLSGELPFRGATRMLLHQVIHDEVPSPRKLNNAIPRDLETITLKCLQKEPGRRYQSAAELSADLELWLDGKPITARPIGRIERSWRWCKRKPALAGLIGVSMAALLILIAGGNAYNLQLKTERDRANNEASNASIARNAADEAREDEEAARIQAEKNLEAAQQTVDEFLTDVSQSNLLNLPQMEPLRRQLLTKAREYYEEFVKQKGEDPKLKAKLGYAHGRLGHILGELGDQAAAIAEYEEMRAIFEQLSKEHPDVREYTFRIAQAYLFLSTLFQRVGKFDEAVGAIEKTVVINEQLVKEHPNVPDYKGNLARSYLGYGGRFFDTGEFDKAVELFEKSIVIAEQLTKEHPAAPDDSALLSAGYNGLALSFYKMGKYDKAIELFEKSNAIAEQIVKEHPNVPDYRQDQATNHQNLATRFWEIGKYDKAVELFEKSIVIAEQLTKEHPAEPLNSDILRGGYNGLGGLFDRMGKTDKALELYEKSIAIVEQLVKEHPNVLNYRQNQAGTYFNLAVIFQKMGKYDKAIELYEKSIVIAEQLVKEHPNVPDYKKDLASSYTSYGHVVKDRGDVDKAIELYEKTIVIAEQLNETYPEVADYTDGLAVTYTSLAYAFRDTGEFDKAMEFLRKAIPIHEQLVTSHPDVPRYANNLAGDGNPSMARQGLREGGSWLSGSVCKLAAGDGVLPQAQ